jgi:probable rRNA maturation factor
MDTRTALQPDIIYEYEPWENIENLEDIVLDTVNQISLALNLDKIVDFVDFSIVLTNDNSIKQLNKDYRNIDKATNVLSFPIEDIDYNHLSQLKELNKSSIGDIIISYDTLLRESVEQSKKFESHFRHLLIHSILHLFGYDHEEDEEAEIMESLEVKILKQMNICSPYE